MGFLLYSVLPIVLFWPVELGFLGALHSTLLMEPTGGLP